MAPSPTCNPANAPGETLLSSTITILGAVNNLKTGSITMLEFLLALPDSNTFKLIFSDRISCNFLTCMEPLGAKVN
jgi:hypothetical protein